MTAGRYGSVLNFRPPEDRNPSPGVGGDTLWQGWSQANQEMADQGWTYYSNPSELPAGAQTTNRAINYTQWDVRVHGDDGGSPDASNQSTMAQYYRAAPAATSAAAATPAAAAFQMPEQSATAPSVNAAKPTDYTVAEKDKGHSILDQFLNTDTSYNQWLKKQESGSTSSGSSSSSGSSNSSTSDKDWSKYYSQQYGDMSKPLANAPTTQADWGSTNRKAGGGDFLASLNNYTAKVPGTSTFA